MVKKLGNVRGIKIISPWAPVGLVSYVLMVIK